MPQPVCSYPGLGGSTPRDLSSKSKYELRTSRQSVKVPYGTRIMSVGDPINESLTCRPVLRKPDYVAIDLSDHSVRSSIHCLRCPPCLLRPDIVVPSRMSFWVRCGVRCDQSPSVSPLRAVSCSDQLVPAPWSLYESFVLLLVIRDQ